MSLSLPKRLLLLVLLVLLLPLAAYWLADTWLESSGGRQLLEQNLSERIGMSVRLGGEFDLMLLPDIGVSGTALVLGGPGPESEFARSEKFEMSIALQPLLDRRVLIDWIRLSGGHVYPERYAGEGGSSEVAGVRLPEIRELTVRDFQFELPGEGASPLRVKELMVSGFAENRETLFKLEIEDLAVVEGRLRWDTSRSVIHFTNVNLLLGEQALSGEGCLFLQNPRSLHFDLQAGALDLDMLRENLPVSGDASGGGLPLEVNARFTIDEVTSSGVIARGVVFSLGGEPACNGIAGRNGEAR